MIKIRFKFKLKKQRIKHHFTNLLVCVSRYHDSMINNMQFNKHRIEKSKEIIIYEDRES